MPKRKAAEIAEDVDAKVEPSKRRRNKPKSDEVDEDSKTEVTDEKIDIKETKGKEKEEVDDTKAGATETRVNVNEKLDFSKYPTFTKVGNITDYLTEPGWRKELESEFKKDYFKAILKFLDGEKAAKKEVFPPEHQIFNAFNFTPFDQVKVVIIGQDPYHDNKQAHGLCFSVQLGVEAPPSLKNIYKELETDIMGFEKPPHGYLEKWARQGVLLLNASLTVEAHKANSHSAIGWMAFTDAVVKIINDRRKGVIFILWGGFAQKKGTKLDIKKQHVIKAAHPSPLSVTKFLGCKVFSKTNKLLEDDGQTPIDWNLEKVPVVSN